jgi:hypothetical protein
VIRIGIGWRKEIENEAIEVMHLEEVGMVVEEEPSIAIVKPTATAHVLWPVLLL